MSYKDIPLFQSPLNRPPIKDMINALIIAREQLGDRIFICSSLPDDYAGNYLRDYISDSLGNCNTLVVWLCEQKNSGYYSNFNTARRQWINWMLKNLRAELKDIQNTSIKHNNNFDLAA